MCFEETASSTIRVVASAPEAKTKVFIPREELQDFVPQSKGSLISRKNHTYIGVHSRKVWVKFCRRSLETQILLKKRDHILGLIRFVSDTEDTEKCWYYKCIYHIQPSFSCKGFCQYKTLKTTPCSRAHYRQGQIKECPLPGDTYRTKNYPCNMQSTARKKKTNISWKGKMKH